jgi:hypothetical protein
MEQLGRSRFAQLLLTVVGGLLLCLSAIAMALSHPVLAGGFAVLAVFVFIMSVLAPRMKGQVAAGLQGFRFELVEEIVRRGPHSGLTTEQLALVVRRALDLALPKGPIERAETDDGTTTPESPDGEISEFGQIQQIADGLIQDAKRE